jgi:hypothetical protein
VRLQKSFQAWARPGFEPFRFDYNADRIDALSSERAAQWRRNDSARVLATDEQLARGPSALEPASATCPT